MGLYALSLLYNSERYKSCESKYRFSLLDCNTIPVRLENTIKAIFDPTHEACSLRECVFI